MRGRRGGFGWEAQIRQRWGDEHPGKQSCPMRKKRLSGGRGQEGERWGETSPTALRPKMEVGSGRK